VVHTIFHELILQKIDIRLPKVDYFYAVKHCQFFLLLFSFSLNTFFAIVVAVKQSRIIEYVYDTCIYIYMNIYILYIYQYDVDLLAPFRRRCIRRSKTDRNRVQINRSFIVLLTSWSTNKLEWTKKIIQLVACLLRLLQDKCDSLRVNLATSGEDRRERFSFPSRIGNSFSSAVSFSFVFFLILKSIAN